ncbi:flippase [Flavobacterium microcysteis]
MRKTFKRLIIEKYRTVFTNFVSLSVLQMLNMILPLITFPYLTRVLGTEIFGLILFSSSVITYFQILTDYSFNLTATKEISLNIENKEKLKELFNDVITTKLLLTIFSFFVLLLVVFSIDKFSEYRLVYLLSFGVIIGQTLFPVWFFQGIQKMKYITYINLTFKTIFTILIFLYVKHQDDYWMVPLFNSCGFIFSGIFSLIYIYKQFNISLKIQSLERIKTQLRIGKYIFLSELKISLFTNTNIILLGFIVGNNAVTYYAGAEKLVRALATIQIPFSNALFPFLSKEMTIDPEKTIKSIIKIVKIGSVILLIGLIPIFIFSEEIIETVYGKNMENSALVLRILLLIPIASFIDNMFGKQILINLGKDNLYFRVITIGTIFNILLNLVLIPQYSYIGTAISLMLTQIIIDIGMIYYSRRYIYMNN